VGIEAVDSLLQAGGLLRPDAQAGAGSLVGGRRHTQVGADVEEVVLDAA